MSGGVAKGLLYDPIDVICSQIVEALAHSPGAKVDLYSGLLAVISDETPQRIAQSKDKSGCRMLLQSYLPDVVRQC